MNVDLNTVITCALDELASIVHDNAKAHGFHDFKENESQFLTRALLLINCEVAELFEAHRQHELRRPCDKASTGLNNLEEELADIVIRALDIAKRMGVDIGNAVARKHAYNVERPYRHGGKAA